MAEVICPENELIVIDKDQLLEKTMEMKHEKLRLSQACASYINGKYELCYSFANDKTYEFKTLKVVMEKDDAVSSTFMRASPGEVYFVISLRFSLSACLSRRTNWS